MKRSPPRQRNGARENVGTLTTRADQGGNEPCPTSTGGQREAQPVHRWKLKTIPSRKGASRVRGHVGTLTTRADQIGNDPCPISTGSQRDTLPKNNVQGTPTRTPSVVRDREATATTDTGITTRVHKVGTVFKMSSRDNISANVLSSVTSACPTVSTLSRSAVTEGACV